MKLICKFIVNTQNAIRSCLLALIFDPTTLIEIAVYAKQRRLNQKQCTIKLTSLSLMVLLFSISLHNYQGVVCFMKSFNVQCIDYIQVFFHSNYNFGKKATTQKHLTDPICVVRYLKTMLNSARNSHC